ncbi:MAG TPA: GPW/gp25 family protein [Nitrospira sp.]|nr:GPW/gp25 family protein [Nitrospira sp.]
MNDFIGTGFRFPIRINGRGGLSWSSGPERIQDSIWIIITTALGERVMRPRFGAGVSNFVLNSNSLVVRTQLSDAIKRALVEWEPRIELEAVRVDEVSEQASQVLIGIDYRLRETNELFNMVYPLYVQEGTI